MLASKDLASGMFLYFFALYFLKYSNLRIFKCIFFLSPAAGDTLQPLIGMNFNEPKFASFKRR